MLQSITVSEFKDLKMVHDELAIAEELIQNTGVSLDIVHNLQEAFNSELDEHDIKELFDMLDFVPVKKSGFDEKMEGVAISSCGGYSLIYINYDIDEQAVIKDNYENILYLCELSYSKDDEGNDIQVIELFDNELPVNEFIKF
ncbi:hypothetical protein [Bacillus phage vB_BanS-Thrax3]|nr:hypothetical protein [Bacillus phage vB_BanS-Thrax1]UUV46648.1 hypothetical protein [Bacillus phage vB_BanS-Thrax3]